MSHNLVTMVGAVPRLWKRAILVGFDICALSFALWASFALRHGNWLPPNTVEQFLAIGTAPLVSIPIFVRFGLYRAVIRYLPERALWTIVQAISLSTACWVVLVFLSELAGRMVVPRSVPIIYWAVAILIVGGSRFLAKSLLWSTKRSGRQQPIAIYGAGEAGVQLANALRRHGSQFIVGFLDDQPSLQGRDLAGIRVFPPSAMPMLAEQYGVQEVILSISTLAPAERQRIVAEIGRHGVKIRTLPPISDLVSGKYLISQIREIDIDELLGRSSVPADQDLLRKMIQGKTIMVTGAGGSIGSELCRLIAKWAPQRLVLFEANEYALYQIERELSGLHDLAVVPVLGSITNQSLLRRALTKDNVQVVFHAAAHKHVPLVEANVLEGIANNVLGTRSVVEASFDHGVESFVLISSDKAVRPTNVMGATKRWAELIVQQKAQEALMRGTGQRFCAVRFGNVLGSNGSVVPLFRQQIAHGGPVTITDMAMTRYFMSIHEAAELIVQAGSLSQGGDVFLLDMGEPVLIKDLAENMIRLAGLTLRDDSNPDGDIELVVTGKRPGEKMYEELFYDDNNADATLHPKIMRAARSDGANGQIDEAMGQLIAALGVENEAAARHILFKHIQ
ncbi:nucleoside-diphosphate sugar epimerase/dehydratase [Devosia sp.]|uniref:polysaccharide biosynthesis protein n=1 Tax=Devosia sp. TaxID=1871048 RepID=UPI002736091D|nr:nucleoside-diphosphate sugar epimerase/dehydratase [Devosia sp.]MDP2782164.1 nucleoside-diphosphate sugar epimerase/dehydratase [Devosia sp.]